MIIGIVAGAFGKIGGSCLTGGFQLIFGLLLLLIGAAIV